MDKFVIRQPQSTKHSGVLADASAEPDSLSSNPSIASAAKPVLFPSLSSASEDTPIILNMAPAPEAEHPQEVLKPTSLPGDINGDNLCRCNSLIVLPYIVF